MLKEKVLDINPFKEKGKGPSPLVNACLDFIDMTKPDKFNKTGERIAGLLRPTAEAVEAVGSGVASGVEGTGNTARGATDTVFDGMNNVNAFFGGDADYWNKEKKVVGTAITGDTDATGKKIREVTGWLDRKADELATREHILRDLYGWFSGIDLLARSRRSRVRSRSSARRSPRWSTTPRRRSTSWPSRSWASCGWPPA